MRVLVVDAEFGGEAMCDNVQASGAELYVSETEGHKCGVGTYIKLDKNTVYEQFAVIVAHVKDAAKYPGLSKLYLASCVSKCTLGLLIEYTGHNDGIEAKVITYDNLWIVETGRAVATTRIERLLRRIQEHGLTSIDLVEYFSVKAGDLLATLSILCQGFLATHGDLLTGDPDDEAGLRSEEYGLCLKALEVMGWKKYVLENGKGKKEILSLLQEPKLREKQRKEAKSAKWWRLLKDSNVIGEFRTQWGSGDRELLSDVEGLLDCICHCGDTIELIFVAKAYLAIRQKLEKRGCGY